MGREAVAVACWRSETAEVRALLESTEIILRGAIRARIPRSAISSIETSEAGIVLIADGEALELDLGAAKSRKWAETLRKPPPTLAEKLGIGPGKCAYVIGAVDDEALATALADSTRDKPDEAIVIVAVLRDEAGLEAVVAEARATPALPVWCVYPRGRSAGIGDGAVRALMRARGYIDTKSCAISDRLTATRYTRRA